MKNIPTLIIIGIIIFGIVVIPIGKSQRPDDNDCEHLMEVYDVLSPTGDHLKVVVDFYYYDDGSRKKGIDEMYVKSYVYNHGYPKESLTNYFNNKLGTCRVKDVVIYPVIVTHEYKLDSDE